mmetsp:Transcript_17920/g.50844  ORF Transcript_17920/g.50844 Transcript_17920/m.50844 type:complete len:874 (-) Transcript_17920:516-3137(-)
MNLVGLGHTVVATTAAGLLQRLMLLKRNGSFDKRRIHAATATAGESAAPRLLDVHVGRSVAFLRFRLFRLHRFCLGLLGWLFLLGFLLLRNWLVHDRTAHVCELDVLRVDIGHREGRVNIGRQRALLVQHFVEPARAFVALAVALRELFVRDVGVLVVALRAGKPSLVLFDVLLQGGDGSWSVLGLLRAHLGWPAQRFELGKLFSVHLLGGIEPVLVKPVFHFGILGQKCFLLGIGAVCAQLRIGGDLISHVVNVRLELVSHVRGLLDHSVVVRHRHLVLVGLVDFFLRPVERSNDGVFQVGPLDLLLLRFLRLVAFPVSSRLFFLLLLGSLFLLLDIFNHLGRTQAEDSVNVLLDVDTHLLLLARRGLDGEGGDVLWRRRGHSKFDAFLVVRSLHAECPVALEGDAADDREVEASIEHDHRVRAVIGRALTVPRNLDRDRLTFDDFVGKDLEAWRQDGRLKGGATRHRLVSIHGSREADSKDSFQLALHATDTRRASNDFHRRQVACLQLGLGECRLDRALETREQGLAHDLVVVGLHLDVEIQIVHQAFQVDGGLLDSLGRQGFLGLFSGSVNLQHDLRPFRRVTGQFLGILLDELRNDVISDHLVEVPSAQVGVAKARLDGQLSGLEGCDGDGVGRCAHVDEHDVGGAFLGELLADVLEDAIGERRGRALVHEALHASNSCNFATAQQRSSLRVGVVGWDCNHPVLREQLLDGVRIGGIGGCSCLLGRDRSHVMDHHAANRLDGHDRLLVVVRDLDSDRCRTSEAVLDRHAFERDALHLLLRPRIVKRQTDESFHELDRVFVVGRCAHGRLLAHLACVPEGNHGSVMARCVANVMTTVTVQAYCEEVVVRFRHQPREIDGRSRLFAVHRR